MVNLYEAKMVYYVALLNYQTAYEYGRKASMTLRHLRNVDSFLNIVIDYQTEEAAIGGDLYGNEGSVPN